ncbi:MAG: SRPBCC domain-containing protein [Roseiflexaceae bacterium]
MNDQNFTTTFTVDQTPEEAFAAITNVRGWWSEEIEGDTDKLGDVFKYHFADVHRCTMQLTEVIPGKKVVWLVLENYFSFTEDKTEWTNTEITFEISKKGDQTEVHFTHLGLVPEYECFDVCSTGWRTYINGSLHSLITAGKGQPNANQRPTNESERKLLESQARE